MDTSLRTEAQALLAAMIGEDLRRESAGNASPILWPCGVVVAGPTGTTVSCSRSTIRVGAFCAGAPNPGETTMKIRVTTPHGARMVWVDGPNQRDACLIARREATGLMDPPADVTAEILDLYAQGPCGMEHGEWSMEK